MAEKTPFKFAYNFIRTEILPDMDVGDKLAGERELAELIGVSRPVVREAKAALWALELITVEHGKPSVKRG